MICEYNGKILNEDEVNDIRDTQYGPYLIRLSDDTVIDSACMRGVGSFLNHKSRSAANTRFTENKVYAEKDIRNGSELFVSYGYGPIQAYLKKGFTIKTVDVENYSVV